MKNSKVISLSLAFISVPAVTVFVMSGMCEKYYAVAAAVLAVLLALLCIAAFRKNRRIAAGLMTVTVFLTAAFIRCVPQYYSETLFADSVIEKLAGKTHNFCGYAEMGDVNTGGRMFVKIVSVDGKELERPVMAYGINRSGHFINEGTYLEFEAKLREPMSYDDLRFDVRGWLSGKGIHCEIYDVYEFEADTAAEKISFGAWLRNKVFEHVRTVLEYIPDKGSFDKSTALCKALLFGDKNGFTVDELESFSKSGLTHLLCVSGLHFSLLIGNITILIGYIIPDRRWRTVILAAISVIYLCMCGFSKSAMRAAVMYFISAAGVTYGKRYGCTHTLIMAVAVICLIDPDAVYDVSFRLSVLACAGIACSAIVTDTISDKLYGRPVLSYIAGTAMMSVSSFLFTFAYSACAFGGVSTASVVTSVLAVLPAQICMILAWISVLIAALNVDFLCFACADIISRLSNFIYEVARFFSGLSFSYIETDIPDLSFTVFMIMLCMISFVTASKARAAKIYFYVFISSFLSVIIMLSTRMS